MQINSSGVGMVCVSGLENFRFKMLEIHRDVVDFSIFPSDVLGSFVAQCKRVSTVLIL